MANKEDFIKLKEGFLNRLRKNECTVEECKKIFQEMQDDNGFQGVIGTLYDAGEFNESYLAEYADLCIELASKCNELGDMALALDVISNARTFLPEDENNSAIRADLDYLETEIKKTKNASTIETEPIKTEQAGEEIEQGVEEKASGSNKMLLYGGVVAILIAAIGFFAFGGKKDTPVMPPPTKPSPAKVQKVFITYDLPEGTQVILDGNNISNVREAEVTVGKHSLELKHSLMDIDYDKNLNVSNAGKIALVKEFKLGGNAKVITQNTVKDMLNDILQQACTSENMVMSASLYTPMADKNERITKAHNAMRNYALKNSLKSMPVENVKLGELELVNKDGGKSFYIKGTAEILGAAGKGKKLNYTVQTTLKIEKDTLLVDSLDAFKAQIAK